MNNKIAMESLIKTVKGEKLSSSLLPYDEEAEFIDTLGVLEYINPLEFEQDTFGNNMKVRAKIRYLVALFPYTNLHETTVRIHTILNNSNVELEDLKIILDGRHISNPQTRTREVSFIKLQGIGKGLREGKHFKDIAIDLGVAVDTVKTIETYLGIKKSYELKLIDRAVSAVRDVKSIREFAEQEGLSYGMAVKSIRKAKQVLTELGETYIERTH